MSASAALFAAAAPAIAAGAADDHPAAAGLVVAIIDLAEAPGLAPPPPAAPRRPSWRTSFGSERQSETKPKAAAGPGPLAAIASADVVLIQGVHAAAPLRRLFPPREWRLVVSRRVIAPPADGAVDGVAANATAIAVRARPDIRMTAREPGLRLVPVADDPALAPPIAATAVRVAARGRVVWLASVVLPPECAGHADCAATAALDAWRTSKRVYGETTLVGGRLASAATKNAAPATPCAAHRIESDLDSAPVALPSDIVLGAGSGCISIVRIEAAAPVGPVSAAVEPAAEPASATREDVAKSPPAP